MTGMAALLLKRPETNRLPPYLQLLLSLSLEKSSSTKKEEKKKKIVATIHIVISKAGSIYLAGWREFLQEIRYPASSSGNSNAEVQEEEEKKRKVKERGNEETRGKGRRSSG